MERPEFGIPAELPPEVLALAPRKRLEVMKIVLQRAKVENAGEEKFWRMFVEYCRVMSAPKMLAD